MLVIYVNLFVQEKFKHELLFLKLFLKNQLIAHSSYPIIFQFYGVCNLSLIKTVSIDAAKYLESFYLRSNRRKNMK